MTVFGDIYRENRWNGVESLSGPGSGASATVRIAASIAALVDELGIGSVLDVGCGDGYWMPDLPGYVGIDISREAIEIAHRRHPDRRYMIGDVAAPPTLRPFDLVILRDALQHLSVADAQSTLAAIRGTGSKWLLASTFHGGENVDIETGDAYSPDLQAEPFNLGTPTRLIFDGWDYRTGTRVRDPRKHLGLWRL